MFTLYVKFFIFFFLIFKYFSGLILQDLTFVHVGNPDYLFSVADESDVVANKLKDNSTITNSLQFEDKENCKNLLNYGKRWQQFAILDNIRRFKSW